MTLSKGDRVAVFTPLGHEMGRGVLLGRARMIANNELEPYMRRVKLDGGLRVTVNKKMLRKVVKRNAS